MLSDVLELVVAANQAPAGTLFLVSFHYKSCYICCNMEPGLSGWDGRYEYVRYEYI